MKKNPTLLVVAGVIVSWISGVYAVPIEVNEVWMASYVPGVAEVREYEGGLQEVVSPQWSGMTTGGSLAQAGDWLTNVGHSERAQVLSVLEIFSDVVLWEVWTGLYGEGVGNAVYMSFSVGVPVNYAFELDNQSDVLPEPELWGGGILGQADSGVLGVGEYVLWYFDAWNTEGEGAYGGFDLKMSASVPDSGSTIWLLGIGIAGLVAARHFRGRRVVA